MGRLDEKIEICVSQNVQKDGCVVGLDVNDWVDMHVCFLWIYVFTSPIGNCL